MEFWKALGITIGLIAIEESTNSGLEIEIPDFKNKKKKKKK